MPNDPSSSSDSAALASVNTPQLSGTPIAIADAEREAELRPSPESYLNLSLVYWQSGRFQDCLSTSRKALGLRPKFAEEYNNISAAYHSLGQFDEAISAARDALRIAPNYRLAKNNLALALRSKGTAS